MAINAWLMMLVASLIWFVRRHHVSALAARAAAPVGATMTLIALLTGAIWGQPMWGTWWAWDPRLTSFFVLFLFYLGYIALWEAVEDPDKAADLTALLCLVGSVFALLSRYAVFFWSQGLHQGAVAVARRPGERRRRLLVAARRLDRRLRAALRRAGAGAHPHRDPRPPAQRARGGGGAGMIPDLGRYAGDRARRLRRHPRAPRRARRRQPLARRAGAPPPRHPRSPEGRPWPLAATGCLILPPLLFLGFAAVAWLGLRREAPQELPSALVGEPAPSLAGAGALDDEPAADRRRPARPRRQARQLLRQLVRPLPRRAPDPDGARRRRASRSSASTTRTGPRRRAAGSTKDGNPFAMIGTDDDGRIGLDWGIYGVPETFVVDCERHHPHALPRSPDPTPRSATASARRWTPPSDRAGRQPALPAARSSPPARPRPSRRWLPPGSTRC